MCFGVTPSLVRTGIHSGKQHFLFQRHSTPIPKSLQKNVPLLTFISVCGTAYAERQRTRPWDRKTSVYSGTAWEHPMWVCSITHTKRFQARARQDSQGKGMEEVQIKARINVSFSRANRGKKFFAESHFPSFSIASSWHVTICLVCNTGEGKLVEVISLHFWILSSLNKRLTTSDIGFLCLMNPCLPLLE